MPQDRLPISCFVIARDEAERIHWTILSVRDLVDEVIVVEWGSSDETAKIAADLGARVIHHPFTGYGPQKRFAESQCRNRWLLNLDADEALSDELQDELRALFAAGPPDDGYRLLIRAMCQHEDRPTRGAYANSPIRLYRRDRGEFSESAVHDSVLMQAGARVSLLKSDVYHRGTLCLEQLIAKSNTYTSMQAEDYVRRRGDRVSWWKMLSVLPLAFLKSYVLRRHFVWGRYGFSISVSYAFSRFARLAKVHEASLQRKHRPAEEVVEVPARKAA